MDDAGKPLDTNNSANAATPSANKFAGSGILLFTDQLIVAAGGWIYWLIISKFATTSEIGHATALYSLVLIINTVIQLGLEYPLLKRSSVQRSQIFGTTILIELAITAVSIPILIYAASNLYQESQQLVWIALGILIFASVGFITRFALLGLSSPKTILLVDIVGLGLKFVIGYALVSSDYGAIGIMLSFFIHTAVLAVGTLFAVKRLFGFGIGNIKLGKEIIKDGLVNMPSKLSSMLIISLSVVLLASFGVSSSEVGIFYIAMMITIVVGSFASSLAFMSIPASSQLSADLSSGSLRIGLSFTVPIIAVLIIAPEAILAMIGTEYLAAREILTILALGILPSVILSNAMSKFNNLNKPNLLLIIGSVRLVVFLLAFFFLVPEYGTLGAAYSILISFASSAILSLIWSEKILFRYIGTAVVSIFAGVATGKLVGLIIEGYPIAIILASIAVTFITVIAFKSISIREIRTIVRSVAR